MSLEHTPKSVAELVTIIGAAAQAAPEIAAFVRGLTEGDRSAVEQLRATLPLDAPTAAWAREHQYKDPPFHGVLAAVADANDTADTDPPTETVVTPPEYEDS